MLSDVDIEQALVQKHIIVSPLFPGSIQAASVDLHLGRHFLVFQKDNHAHIDPRESVAPMMRRVQIGLDRPFTLHSKEFALGVTEECIGVNDEHVGRIDGTSSIGRLGTCVHITASMLNPGHRLHMTLELYNATHAPILLYWGMPIAQMTFDRLINSSKNSYGSKKVKSSYGATKLPQPSQYYKKFLPGNNAWEEYINSIAKKRSKKT
jgi:dCTP deaminase